MTPSSKIKNVPFSMAHGSRIGLFGGSFNPAHEGHNHIATVALKQLNLQEIWWLVSPQNPLKTAQGAADLQARMVQAGATAKHPNFRVSDMENRLGTTYSIDIIRILIKRFPNVHFVWIMGADNFIQLPKWRAWDKLMEEIPVAVIARPGHHIRAGLCQAADRYKSFRIPQSQAGSLYLYKAPAWSFLMTRLHPASSTAIRQERSGQSDN